MHPSHLINWQPNKLHSCKLQISIYLSLTRSLKSLQVPIYQFLNVSCVFDLFVDPYIDNVCPCLTILRQQLEWVSGFGWKGRGGGGVFVWFHGGLELKPNEDIIKTSFIVKSRTLEWVITSRGIFYFSRVNFCFILRKEDVNFDI